MATLHQLQQGLVKANKDGNQEHVDVISESIRQHPTYQKQGQEALAKGFKALSGDERKQAIHQNTAKALGIKPSDLDSERGMGGWGRFKLGLQPTEADKAKSLEDTYGRENLKALDIGGNMEFLYRDEEETGGKWRRVDEQGFSLSDIFADTSGAVLPTAAAVGTAIATGGASIPVMALAAAGGGLAAGVAQDVGVRAASGEDIRFGEIAKRQAFTNALGIPIDMVTGVGGRMLMKTVGRRAVDQASDTLVRGIDDLVSKYDPEAAVKLTAAQEASTDASLKQSIRAGMDPKGLEARAYEKQRDEILKLNRAIKGEAGMDEPIEDVMQSVAERQMRLIDAYESRVKKMTEAKVDADAAMKKQTSAQRAATKKRLLAESDEEIAAMRKQAEDGIRKLNKGRDRLTSVMGDDIRGQQERAFAGVQKESNDLYEEAYRLLDTPNANTPVSSIQRVLDRIDDAALDETAPELAAIKRLRARVSDQTKPQELTFRELDRYLREITDKINYKKKFNVGESQYQLQQIGKRLEKLRSDAMGPPKKAGAVGAGKPARDAYNRAKKNYRNKVLPYFDGDRAANLGRVIGGSAEAVGARGENVLARTFATRASVQDAIKSGVDRKTLQDAYIDKVVQDSAGGQVSVDRNIIQALYGDTAKAKQVLSDINRINKAIKAGGKKAKVTKEEIDGVMSEFEPAAKAKKLRAITEKEATEKKLAAARKSALQKVIRGEMPTPDDIHHFVDDIASLRPGQIKKLMDRLPNDSSRASLRRSGIDRLYEEAGQKSIKAQRSGVKTGREALWEPETMFEILNNSQQRAQWEAMLGKETVADIEKLNRWLLSSAELRDTTQEGIGRLVTSTGASGAPNVLFVSPQLPRWLGRKMLGVIHTSPIARGMMVRHLKEGDIDEELFQRLFYMTMGTRRGMDAVSSEMAKDPAFSEWIQESMREQQ